MANPILPDGESVIITSLEWSEIADSINALFCSLHKCGDVDEVERLDLARGAYSRLSQTIAPINERLSEGGAQ